ncbi:unnamed protein product, partial [Rhizoctonia solani]
MSSPPGTPKKKGMRSLWATSFGRSRSRSPSHSSAAPNEATGLGARVYPISSPTVSPTLSPNSAHPTIPIIIEPNAATLGQTRDNAAVSGLWKSLGVLRDNASVFPPLSSAAGIILSCIEAFEAVGNNRQEYEDLFTELARLSEFLSQRMQGSGSLPASKSFLSISKSIEQQAQEIKAKLGRGVGERLRQTTMDEEELLRQYRRIESLFRQLQTDASLSTWSIVNKQLA